MKIAVLGTGSAGQTLAAGLVAQGHEVTVGTRDVAASLARTDPDQYGAPGFGTWAAERPEIAVATLADAASGAELVINALTASAAVEGLAASGRDALAGKVLIDVSNPVDFAKGFPPPLLITVDESLGERIQAAFPEAKVVKTLNTAAAPLLAGPGTGDHTVFVSGNDDEAKKTVTELLAGLGHTDVLDLGDITTARGPELHVQLWLQILQATGSVLFNFKVVR